MLCVSPLSFHIKILLFQHGRSALDTSRTLFLLASTQGWYTTIHQNKYSRWNINNCGAGTLGKETYIHLLTYIWGRDEREHIHISGDSSFHIKILLFQHGRSALDTSRTLFLLASTQGVSCRLVMNHLIYVYVLSLYNETREILLWRWTTYHLCIYTDSRLGYDYWWLFINLYKWKSMNNSWRINIQKVTYHTCILLSLSALQLCNRKGDVFFNHFGSAFNTNKILIILSLFWQHHYGLNRTLMSLTTQTEPSRTDG
jgi:hypothetical protein